MADLTFPTAAVVNDGNNAAITGGVKIYNDPNDSNKKGAVVALLGADGLPWRSNQSLTVQNTVTRAANTTQYAVGDVVGGVITLTNIVPGAGEWFLTDISLLWNISALPAAMTSFRLYMYNVTPPSAILDNSPWTFGSGDRASFIGHVDLGTFALLGTGTGSVYNKAKGVNERIKTLGGTVYGYLVTNGAYTPAANSETGTITTQTSPTP